MIGFVWVERGRVEREKGYRDIEDGGKVKEGGWYKESEECDNKDQYTYHDDCIPVRSELDKSSVQKLLWITVIHLIYEPGG